MFVIAQAYDNYCRERADGAGRSAATAEGKFGHAMRVSGVAVTITSLTDFASFGLGATTVSRRTI